MVLDCTALPMVVKRLFKYGPTSSKVASLPRFETFWQGSRSKWELNFVVGVAGQLGEGGERFVQRACLSRCSFS